MITKKIYKELQNQGYRQIPLVQKLGTKVSSIQSFFEKLPFSKKNLLESSKTSDTEHYSFVTFDEQILRIYKNSVVLEDGKIVSKDPLKYLETLVDSWKTPCLEEYKNIPFIGGALVLLSYDFRCFIENLPEHKVNDLKTPAAVFALCNKVLAFDHRSCELFLFVSEDSYESSHRRLFQLKQDIESCSEKKTANRPTQNPIQASDFYSNFSQKRYCESVEKIKHYIRKGHTYQVNLSQRFCSKKQKSSWEIYKTLTASNPVFFGGFFQTKDFSLICVSPERLVKSFQGQLWTRPIAGTYKKNKNLVQSFLKDPKEKAEHAMLVDLARNDMGKVCVPGSIKVSSYRELVKYKHVMHFESDVTGVLEKLKTPFAVIKALFPGGTITGVPKIRTMEIIGEFEKHSRGFYTGSLGYLDFRKHLDLNIIIRSIVSQNQKLYIHVGGGVTIDSDPKKEYEETLHKAKTQFEAILL